MNLHRSFWPGLLSLTRIVRNELTILKNQSNNYWYGRSTLDNHSPTQASPVRCPFKRRLGTIRTEEVPKEMQSEVEIHFDPANDGLEPILTKEDSLFIRQKAEDSTRLVAFEPAITALEGMYTFPCELVPV